MGYTPNVYEGDILNKRFTTDEVNIWGSQGGGDKGGTWHRPVFHRGKNSLDESAAFFFKVNQIPSEYLNTKFLQNFVGI